MEEVVAKYFWFKRIFKKIITDLCNMYVVIIFITWILSFQSCIHVYNAV